MNKHLEFIYTDDENDSNTRIDIDFDLTGILSMDKFTEMCVTFARAIGFMDITIGKFMDAEGLADS